MIMIMIIIIIQFAVLKAILYISFNVAIEIQKFNINSLHHAFTHSRSIADCITVSSTTVQTFKPSERQSCYVARSNVNRSVEFNMNKAIQNNIM